MNIIGNKIIELDEIDSTNSYASTLLLNDKQSDGTIVLANYQSNGKGQGVNKWYSSKGENILMSVILNQLKLEASNQFFISEMVALSILNTIKGKFDLNVKIKWPNDIYFEMKKLAGILIKCSIGEGIVKNSIVGIGININQKNFSNCIPNATSLSVILERKIDKEEFFYSLIQNLNDNYLHLFSKDFDYLKKEYEKNLLGLNREMDFIDDMGNYFKGVIKGIDNSGELRIRIQEEMRTFRHGQISLKLK